MDCSIVHPSNAGPIYITAKTETTNIPREELELLIAGDGFPDA